MSTRILSLGLLLALAWSPIESLGQTASDAGLEKGLQLVKQGENGQAIIVLDPVARRLAQNPALKKKAALAYLNLGIAYVGEGQEALAKASFREAVSRDETLQLSAFDVSPKVRDLFQKATDEMVQQRAAAAPVKKGGSKAPWIIVGVAAAGGGVALAAKGSGGGSLSGGSISLGASCTTCLVGSFINFNVTFSGPCSGQAATIWNFGDGATGSFSTPQHTYNAPGAFTVTTSTMCGNSTVNASLALTIKSLSGVWDVRNDTGETFVLTLTQAGQVVNGDADGVDVNGQTRTGGTVGLTLFATSCSGGGPNGNFSGTVDSTLDTVAGPGSLPCRRTVVQQTFTRRK